MGSNVNKETDFDADVLLVDEVRNGNVDAYEGLMRRHNQRLFRVARSIVKDDDEAVDIVQEAFIAAFSRLGELREPRAFASWVARIAKNGALMRVRKNRWYVRADEEQLEKAMETSVSLEHSPRPENELSNQQLGNLLEACIDELPENFRTVYMLRALEGCSTRETADILEIPEATVKTRFHRANRLLKQRILEYSDVTLATLHEFAGHRCDNVVRNVLNHLRNTLSGKHKGESTSC